MRIYWDGEDQEESVLANPDVLEFIEPEGPAITEEMDDLSQEAFAQLTERQQQVWQLIMREGKTEQSAADDLGITQQAVNKLLNRAKATYTNYIYEHKGGLAE